MLPGGLSVVGAYVAMPLTADSTRNNKVRNLLSILHKHSVAPYSTHLGVPVRQTHMMAITMCPQTLK